MLRAEQNMIKNEVTGTTLSLSIEGLILNTGLLNEKVYNTWKDQPIVKSISSHTKNLTFCKIPTCATGYHIGFMVM